VIYYYSLYLHKQTKNTPIQIFYFNKNIKLNVKIFPNLFDLVFKNNLIVRFCLEIVL